MDQQWLTARLLARPPRPADRDGYLDLFLDPVVGEWLGPTPSEHLAEGEVLTMLGADERHWGEYGFGPWLVSEREAGAMVGRGGLRWTYVDGAPVVELPWAIGSAHWGRGFATEAAVAAVEWARTLDLTELVALIVPANSRSRRVAEKAGLTVSGETLHAGLPHLVYRISLTTEGADSAER